MIPYGYFILVIPVVTLLNSGYVEYFLCTFCFSFVVNVNVQGVHLILPPIAIPTYDQTLSHRGWSDMGYL